MNQLETEKSKMVSWAFTVKDNRVDSTDYKEFFDRLESKGCNVTHKYGEYDKKGKLHYHGVVQIPKGVYRKSLLPNGLHMQLKELFDLKGWEKYIKKDQKGEGEDDVAENRDEEANSRPVKKTKSLFIKHVVDTSDLEELEPISPLPDNFKIPKTSMFKN